MLKTSGTHEIEISWEPPKGDFTKYILSGKKINMYNFLRNSIVKVQKNLQLIRYHHPKYISILTEIKIPLEPGMDTLFHV